MLSKLSLSVSFLSTLALNELKSVFLVNSFCSSNVKSAKSFGTVINFGIVSTCVIFSNSSLVA